MTDYSKLPGIADANAYPYFPPIVGDGEQVRCWECEYHKNSVCERCGNPEHCDWCECATNGERTVAPCEQYNHYGACPCNGKFQRGKRGFEWASGRCPRLPNLRGFVAEPERELYKSIFPLVHAERGEDSLSLSLSLPGVKRLKKVYHHCYKPLDLHEWWFRDGKDEYGYPIRRVLEMEHRFHTEQEITDYMELRNYDYCIFRCDITNNFL